MNLHNQIIVLGLFTIWMCLLDFTSSFPSLMMPRLHRSVEVVANNKNMGFPQTDDDVLQLEQLRDVHSEQLLNFNQQKKDELMADEAGPLVEESVPELEQQLESAKPEVESTQGPVQAGVENVGETPEVPANEPKGMGAHRPPTLKSNDGGKVENSQDKPKAKAAESLLRHGNGQYSSFDMAQYVFWTGDEAGVARAVEELIQQNLMTREDALKFLHEIRVGIEYLQKSYANRIFPEEIKHNTIKKSYMPQPLPTTTSTTTTTTQKPTLPYLNLERNVNDREGINIAKTLDNISLWHKLQAMHNGEGRQDIVEYESESRRPKITDCQHKEYNLEEIIYKLARIMFTESLAHGDEAQREIQKLMDFFEREHELGIIPLDLEQKVIHVLLQALSDTLTEKPELWPAAQYPYNRLLRSYAHMNFARPSPANV